MIIDMFKMNNILWRIELVNPNDSILIDRTGKLTIGVTDPSTYTISLNNTLYGDKLITVLLHELGHCAMISYGMLDYIHVMVKQEYWIEAEEYICNFLADYGFKIFSIAFKALGYKAWEKVPLLYDKIFLEERRK